MHINILCSKQLLIIKVLYFFYFLAIIISRKTNKIMILLLRFIMIAARNLLWLSCKVTYFSLWEDFGSSSRHRMIKLFLWDQTIMFVQTSSLLSSSKDFNFIFWLKNYLLSDIYAFKRCMIQISFDEGDRQQASKKSNKSNKPRKNESPTSSAMRTQNRNYSTLFVSTHF